MADGIAATADDRDAEIARLHKIVKTLMDRAERDTSAHASEFSMFRTSIMLEDQVRVRTAELEEALRENEKVSRALRESEAKFRGLVSQSMVGIVIVEDGRFTYSNAKFDEMFGYGSDEVRELSPPLIAVEADRAVVAERTRPRVGGEIDAVNYGFRGLRKDGTILSVECHSSVMRVGTRLFRISLLMDVTDRRAAERAVELLQERLWEQSLHDELTGLHNRRFLYEFVGHRLVQAGLCGERVAVVMGDLDHFKAVNDGFGHLAGDEALRMVGALMKESFRPSDIVCRYGGEEFLMVLPGVGRQAAVSRVEQVRRAIAATPVIHGHERIPITASFGIAVFPDDGTSRDELIRVADRALYAAKAGGRNRVETGEPRRRASSPVDGGCPGESLLPPGHDQSPADGSQRRSRR